MNEQENIGCGVPVFRPHLTPMQQPSRTRGADHLTQVERRYDQRPVEQHEQEGLWGSKTASVAIPLSPDGVLARHTLLTNSVLLPRILRV